MRFFSVADSKQIKQPINLTKQTRCMLAMCGPKVYFIIYNLHNNVTICEFHTGIFIVPYKLEHDLCSN